MQHVSHQLANRIKAGSERGHAPPLNHGGAARHSINQCDHYLKPCNQIFTYSILKDQIFRGVTATVHILFVPVAHLNPSVLGRTKMLGGVWLPWPILCPLSVVTIYIAALDASWVLLAYGTPGWTHCIGGDILEAKKQPKTVLLSSPENNSFIYFIKSYMYVCGTQVGYYYIIKVLVLLVSYSPPCTCALWVPTHCIMRVCVHTSFVYTT